MAELAAAIAAIRAKPQPPTLSLVLDDAQLERSLRHALRRNIRGNKPNAAAIADGADPRGPLDYQALARAIIDGHATLNNEVRTMIRMLQDELFRLRARNAFLDGDKIGLLGHRRFEAPSRVQSKAANRHSRRTLQLIDAHLTAIWELTDGDEDSLEGFENLIVALIERGMPGSGCLLAQRWVTKSVIAKLHAQPLTRARLEIERTRHKIWAPSAFNTQERVGHVGARQWRATRKFMGRQMPGATHLLASRREGVGLAKLWTPLGPIMEDAEKEEDVEKLEAAAYARAEKTRERERREQDALSYKASKDMEARAQGDAMDTEASLGEFDAVGIDLLVAHQPKAWRAARKKATATRIWREGGELGTVFEGAVVHHLLIVAADRTLLGFVKVLVTDHEAFIDELHVAPAGRRQKLSYHLLAVTKQLELPDDLLVRLHVEIANKWAVQAYEGSGMTVWGTMDDEGIWHAPANQEIWGDGDGPDDAAHQMMAASARTVVAAASAKCAGAPLPPACCVLHFIDGEACAPAVEVDWHAKFNEARRAEIEKRGPRDEQERLTLSSGTLNLIDPLARQIIGRSIHNTVLPNSNSASVGFVLSADKGHMKNTSDRRFRDVTLAMLILKCWGVRGDGEDWGLAHVRHGMPNSQSPDYAFVLRTWLGDDHAANLLKGFVPYMEMMQSLRKTAMRIPHMWLMLPPILYGPTFEIIKKFAVGKKDDYLKRYAAIAGPEISAKGMVNMDLSAENELTGQHYGGDGEKNQSSWANDDTHNDQSRICEIRALAATRTLKEEVKDRWPKAWKAMLAVVLLMNDPTIDWSHATRQPEMKDLPLDETDEQAAGSNAFPRAPGRGGGKRAAPAAGKAAGGKAKKTPAGGKAKKAKGANAAPQPPPAPRNVEVDDAELLKTKEYVIPEVNRVSVKLKIKADTFDYASFKSELDGLQVEAAESTSNKVRLIRWPAISAFGSRTDLAGMLGGDIEIARKFMGMCILHADMRVPEDMAEHFEAKLRERVNSGGSDTQAHLKKFNDVMSSWLKMRHSIKKSATTNACYPVSFDGTDSRNLRTDWLLLASVHDLNECAATGKYPSKYFQALHDALVAAGSSVDVLADLPAYASCALHYALAMREARKMPVDLRPDPEPAYLIFESESRLFVSEYIALGWSMKAYGFHLWANMPTLFRKWGSLEGISQTCVEGMIGKVARLMPHLQVKPVGPYPKEIRGCREKELEELERRRAHADAPAEAITENLMMETLEARYGLTPNDKDALPLREILLKIDDAILAGNVVANAIYVTYWRRYMAVEKLRMTARGSGQTKRGHARADPRLAAVRAETEGYYSPAAHHHRVSSAHTNKEWDKLMQASRKKAWREASIGVRPEGGGCREGGGKLAYQQTPYFMLRCGESAARVLTAAESAAWLQSYLAGTLQHEGGRLRMHA